MSRRLHTSRSPHVYASRLFLRRGQEAHKCLNISPFLCRLPPIRSSPVCPFPRISVYSETRRPDTSRHVPDLGEGLAHEAGRCAGIGPWCSCRVRMVHHYTCTILIHHVYYPRRTTGACTCRAGSDGFRTGQKAILEVKIALCTHLVGCLVSGAHAVCVSMVHLGILCCGPWKPSFPSVQDRPVALPEAAAFGGPSPRVYMGWQAILLLNSHVGGGGAVCGNDKEGRFREGSCPSMVKACVMPTGPSRAAMTPTFSGT
jgi:hypothetical protein